MEENRNIEKGERAIINLDTGDVARYSLIMITSFIATIAIATIARHVIRNNLGLTILLGASILISVFLAMRFAQVHVKGYVERYGWFVIPPALAALFMFSSLKPVVFVMLFMAHGLVCFFLKTLKNIARVGIELIMLITILGSLAYGPKTGALLGATAMLMDYILTARLSYFAPITMSSYALIGLLAGNFSAYGITTIGVAAAVIYNAVTTSIIVTFMGGNLDKCLRFGISNIAINAMLFASVAPWLLSIVT